ncbi:MAG: tetratricopeptide repeat protein [Acidobacteriota bacterium]
MRRRAPALTLILLTFCLVAFTASSCRGPGPAVDEAPSDALVAATHRGIAYLENKEAKSARDAFLEATELGPDRPLVWRNLARAELLARESDRAREHLRRASSLEAGSAATSYLLGLVDTRESQFEAAVGHFETTLRLDATAAAHFQLANAYQALGRHELARERLQDTLALDPLHATAHYRLGLYAQQLGDADAYQHHQERFQALREIAGDQSRTAEALEVSVHKLPESFDASPGPVTGSDAPLPRFADATEEVLTTAVDREVVAVAILDVDADASPRGLALAADGSTFLVAAAADGAVSASPLPLQLPPLAADADRGRVQLVVGNVFDLPPVEGPFDPQRDAFSDVAIVHPDGLRLWRGGADGGFVDVTTDAGFGDVVARRALWIDAEADGDLDLAIATDDGPDLWLNQGDGSFSAVGGFVGIVFDNVVPVDDLASADLEGDVVLDLMTAGGNGVTVFGNQRLGRFEGRAGATTDPIRRLALNHLDPDGRPDAVLLGEGGLLVHSADGTLRELLGADAATAFTLVDLVDLDLDGWLDIVVGGTGLRAWRNLGTDGFDEITTALGFDTLDLPTIHDLVATDLDDRGRGAFELLLATADGLRVLRHDGPPLPHRALTLRLVGTKTNPLGVGTRLEIKAGQQHLVRHVQELPITVGLGTPAATLDTVRVVWTNGIVDNAIDFDVANPPDAGVILEKNVAAGSCPFLYAWDGSRYRFVTDTLGNSPLGLSLRRGVPLDADPDELVWIGGDEALAPRDGRYLLRVTEEMREVLYLDEARLVAVDHRPSTEVHSTDKLMPAPFPPSEIWGLVDLRSPTRVESSDGVDRRSAVRTLDGRFAEPGPLKPPPLRGVTERLETTFDFGPIDPSKPLVLALTGWLQYGDASTNIAVSQGAADAPPPWLEAETTTGFVRLDVAVGLPAGKTKTILVDLDDRLPADTRRLRLVTHAEVRWDRIVLGERRRGSILRHDLEPIAAELAWRGFSEIRARAVGHPTTPDHDRVFERPPWRTALEGWVTRYGDVLDLTTQRDDRLALVAAGDALDLAFDAAALPPVPDGHVRTFFFYSVGWDKDGDPNVIDGHTVEPLPVVADDPTARRLDTRWVPRDRFAGGR